jgi:hypothetical protein
MIREKQAADSLPPLAKLDLAAEYRRKALEALPIQSKALAEDFIAEFGANASKPIARYGLPALEIIEAAAQERRENAALEAFERFGGEKLIGALDATGVKSYKLFEDYGRCRQGKSVFEVMAEKGPELFRRISGFNAELDKPVSGPEYSIAKRRGWVFPDGHRWDGDTLVFEQPPGSPAYLLGYAGTQIRFIQGVKGAAPSKAQDKHPAEQLAERFIAAAKPLYELGLDVTIDRIDPAHIQGKKVRDMFFDSECRLNPKRERVRILFQ